MVKVNTERERERISLRLSKTIRISIYCPNKTINKLYRLKQSTTMDSVWVGTIVYGDGMGTSSDYIHQTDIHTHIYIYIHCILYTHTFSPIRSKKEKDSHCAGSEQSTSCNRENQTSSKSPSNQTCSYSKPHRVGYIRSLIKSGSIIIIIICIEFQYHYEHVCLSVLINVLVMMKIIIIVYYNGPKCGYNIWYGSWSSVCGGGDGIDGTKPYAYKR